MVKSIKITNIYRSTDKRRKHRSTYEKINKYDNKSIQLDKQFIR